MYLICDNQIPGRYFADGAIYDSLEDIQQQLADYHAIDWEEDEDIFSLPLSDLLAYGDWSVIEANTGHVVSADVSPEQEPHV